MISSLHCSYLDQEALNPQREEIDSLKLKKFFFAHKTSHLSEARHFVD